MYAEYHIEGSSLQSHCVKLYLFLLLTGQHSDETLSAVFRTDEVQLMLGNSEGFPLKVLGCRQKG